eukprot:1518192-Rhodomonas_salina.1
MVVPNGTPEQDMVGPNETTEQDWAGQRPGPHVTSGLASGGFTRQNQTHYNNVLRTDRIKTVGFFSLDFAGWSVEVRESGV